MEKWVDVISKQRILDRKYSEPQKKAELGPGVNLIHGVSSMLYAVETLKVIAPLPILVSVRMV